MKQVLLILLLHIVIPFPSMSQDTQPIGPAKGYLAPTLHLEPRKATAEEFADVFARQILTRKAGLGQINGDFFVSLGRDETNQIIQPKLPNWIGLNRDQKELVFLFNGAIYHANALPKDFDVTRSILVSFEGNVVRVFDFKNFSGGLWVRE